MAREALARGVPRAPAGGHGGAVQGRVHRYQDRGRLPVPRVRCRAVPLGRQVRFALRVAQLLPANRRRRGRAAQGRLARPRPHRGTVRRVRLAPGPRIRGRGLPGAHRPAVVHQLGVAVPRAGRELARRPGWVWRAGGRGGGDEKLPRAHDGGAGLLNEYAELHLMTGGDPFRARSYEKAARSIAGLAEDVSQLGPERLQAIPGVGKAIAGKVAEIGETGTFAALERLRAQIPDGVLQLTRIPALGPKRALLLYRELHVGSPDELRDAIKAGRLAGLRGFGSKSEEKLLRGIGLLDAAGGRVLLNVADETAARVVEVISAIPGCQRCAPAGSLRRFAETIGA